MRLLKAQTLSQTKDSDDVPPYAILSHTWGEDEVTFRDLAEGTGQSKAAYQKIRFCAQQAAKDGLQYFWVDTCCIDKSNSAELSEAINSMFRWYQHASKCYVYLQDISISDPYTDGQISQSVRESDFRKSRWFTRGWTLLELIAPASVDFFSREGASLGDKISLEQQIHEITRIPVGAIQGTTPLSSFSITERMSWAANRQTTREEDKAYSLLGIFDVHMPLIYGEGGENAFNRLREEIEKSFNRELSAISLPPSTIPFRRNQDFVNRRFILDQINQKCAVPGSRTALVGLGGIGKTQLATEYLYRVREQSPSTSVFWVHASSRARFEESYQLIAEYAKIPGRKHPQADVLKLVHGWLQKETNRWILVLDNVDDADFLFNSPRTIKAGQDEGENMLSSQPLVSYLPQSEEGSILLTTRARSAALRLVELTDIIEVGPLDRRNAISLVQNKLHTPQDNEDFAELVEALEFIPLAIVQAAAYISQRVPRYSVRHFLEAFRENDRNKISLLRREVSLRRDAEARDAVMSTWQISFDYIRQTRPSSADLLSLMSFFDRQGIPEALIRKRPQTRTIHQHKWSAARDDNQYEASDSSNRDEFESQFEDDIQTLRDHSLISIAFDGVTFQMHALVQLAMRAWLEDQGELERWKQQFIENLTEEFPTGEYENWTKCLSLFPHAQAAMTEQPQDEYSIRHWATLLYNVAWYAWKRGILADAEEMSVKSMEARKDLLGPEHVETLSSMAMVGLVYKLIGRWKEAAELEMQVMDAKMRVLGPEHPDTLASLSNLASTYRNQGQWEKAEELEERVLNTKMSVLGLEHPSTLTSMANLASTFWNQGRWKEAEELEVQVMEARKKVLGAEHPSTLTSMANLASTFWNQGRWKEAEELFVQVTEMRKRVLGAEHPDTLTSMANLASTYRNQGRWKEAEELEVQVMETSLRVLGAEHPSTLTSMANLASTFWNQGRWKEAEELEVQVMETSLRVLGAEHPSTLTSMANLASTFWNQGRWKEAEELEVQVMETFKRVLGEEHPSTLTSMANLASTYRNQGRWKEAEELEVQVMETSLRVLGAEHPSTLTSMANLASTYRNQGRWKEAEELEVQVMETRKRVLGAEHPSTLTSMANLASTFWNQGRWKEAEELEVQVMETRKRVLGAEHPSTLTSMANLASTYRNQGQWKKAEDLQAQELETCSRVLGEEHPDTLISMENLALIWRGNGRDIEALQLLQKCVRLRKQILGGDHPYTISSSARLIEWQMEKLNV